MHNSTGWSSVRGVKRDSLQCRSSPFTSTFPDGLRIADFESERRAVLNVGDA